MNTPKISILKSLIEDNLKNANNKTSNEQLIFSFIEALSSGGEMSDPFFRDALLHIREELNEIDLTERKSKIEDLKQYWSSIFPEGLLYFENHEQVIADVRKKRSISINNLNKSPINDVPGEMTITSNVLLTIPDKNADLGKLDLPGEIRAALPEIMEEEQLFWFDHPVQIGEEQDKNEIIYGLKGLSETFLYEKEHNLIDKNATLDVLLSVSVTHKGLQNLAAPYLRYEISQCNDIQGLNIFIFTEKECMELLNELSHDSEEIEKYFGVDGKYGRHYNFLKAINVFWKFSMNSDLKGTFKIDLDQIFPQQKLVDYTGKSAFQHFQSPLWGALGTDEKGRKVNLSMIAGALVNESDIEKSLFTPDVSMPDLEAPLHDLLFFKHLTMALSTRAELMTRYNTTDGLDGLNKALSRIHVTGGTNGILIDALIKYRPFTPSFIGRAEDQAYILSVINKKNQPLLRYYHEDGLIMRHDKEAFAGDSIKAAKDGTYIADIMRILYYTYYAQALPGGVNSIKEETYPFTGSYISQFPFTVSYFRFISKLLEMYEEGLIERADNMLILGETRLQPLITQLSKRNFLKSEYGDEKKQWNHFYDEIELMFKNLELKNENTIKRQKRIRKILEKCKVT